LLFGVRRPRYRSSAIRRHLAAGIAGRVAAAAVKAQNGAGRRAREDAMPRFMPGFVAAVCGVLLGGSAPASAEIDCTPYCDFVHYYGPLDFTYVRPGLFAYPRCGPSGDCSPYLVSSSRRYVGRITVRRIARPVRPRP
jgi:hypothetical protein